MYTFSTKAGKFIRKAIKFYDVFGGLNKYINSRDFWYFHKYSSSLILVVLCYFIFLSSDATAVAVTTDAAFHFIYIVHEPLIPNYIQHNIHI
jgi:hypothetical protein